MHETSGFFNPFIHEYLQHVFTIHPVPQKVNSNSLFLLSSYLTQKNNPTDMTCNIYTFCQQDYGFYSAENISLISHTHLARSILGSESQLRSPSADKPTLPSSHQLPFLYYFIRLFCRGCFNSKISN